MNESANVLLMIESLLPDMHRVERQIATAILQSPESVIHMTVSQLSGQTGVAQSSIIRFCRTLGFEGYRQLKIEIALVLQDKGDVIMDDIQLDDDISTVCSKVFSVGSQTLEEALKGLNMVEMETVVKKMLQAKRVFFFAMGFSAPVAQDAASRFMRAGFPAQAGVDPHICLALANTMDTGCLVIGISHMGRTPELLRALDVAKSRHATVVSVTSTMRSPITEIANHNLILVSRESQYMREAITSRIGHIVLLDCLYVCASLCEHEKSSKTMKSYVKLLNQARTN